MSVSNSHEQITTIIKNTSTLHFIGGVSGRHETYEVKRVNRLMNKIFCSEFHEIILFQKNQTLFIESMIISEVD